MNYNINWESALLKNIHDLFRIIDKPRIQLFSCHLISRHELNRGPGLKNTLNVFFLSIKTLKN